jgi:hypothetical protein
MNEFQTYRSFQLANFLRELCVASEAEVIIGCSQFVKRSIIDSGQATLLSRLRDPPLLKRSATCEACSHRAESSRRGGFLFLRQLMQRPSHGALAQRRVGIDYFRDAHVSARHSSRKATEIRVPLTRGLPPR